MKLPPNVLSLTLAISQSVRRCCCCDYGYRSKVLQISSLFSYMRLAVMSQRLVAISSIVWRRRHGTLYLDLLHMPINQPCKLKPSTMTYLGKPLVTGGGLNLVHQSFGQLWSSRKKHVCFSRHNNAKPPCCLVVFLCPLPQTKQKGFLWLSLRECCRLLCPYQIKVSSCSYHSVDCDNSEVLTWIVSWVLGNCNKMLVTTLAVRCSCLGSHHILLKHATWRLETGMLLFSKQ